MMKNNALEQALPFLNRIDSSRREQFENYFRTAPLWLINTCVGEEMKKGNVFVREGDPVNMIYLIGEGLIKATDYRIYGIRYDFVLFSKVYAFGGMEIIINLDKYQTTLQTVTDCTVLKIPKAGFQKWMDTDITALKQEARLMGEYLLRQDREGRALLFLQGANRVAMVLANRYKQHAENGVLKMKGDRQELSDFTGLCVKTITRSIKKFREEGMITTSGNYIMIDRGQYLRLKKLVSEILAEDF